MISKEFVAEHNEKCVYTYTIKNSSGAYVTINSCGATITKIVVPDKNGQLGDVVLGFDDQKAYFGPHPSFGSTVGRYANRIAKAKFSINGKEYFLNKNESENCLHGGIKGFSTLVWEGKECGENAVVMSLVSPDGDENFPGELTVHVKFAFDDENCLTIEYNATCDKDTVCNLTNHSYFNLNCAKSDVLDEILQINAHYYTPVASDLIPTGEIAPVKDTPLDFTTPHPVGDRINDDFEQIKLCGGYDHNFIIDGEGFRLAAQVYDKQSGRFMEMYTDKPAVQLYTASALEQEGGKGGQTYHKYDAICLESQYCPDTPNQPNFGSCILKAGEEYSFKTAYKFGVK